MTSLPAEVAEVGQLLMLKRGHWGTCNRLHWIGDEVFGEDASLIHSGSGPQVMEALGNTALNVLHQAGIIGLSHACATTVANPTIF